ncbi:MAG: hypothetical protein JWP29_3133 [Rhodoferax sp.]|nr:hypothetical protein [Rhodoferax sp.]
MENLHSSVGAAEWLLLVVSLPTQAATARMRIWRSLKAMGCAALRDGAYLLPGHAAHLEALQELADACAREGGSAWLMAVAPASPTDVGAYPQLFDRRADYAVLVKSWKEAASALPSLSVAELARLQKKLRRDYEALVATDFFPGEATLEAETSWASFNQRITRLLSPDEPHDTEGRIPRRNPADYQGRLWATRRRLWVDRVASAWLIRRFIDAGAQFHWLANASECPPNALGFDFDGAAFTHVGERVTFETLAASFGLEDNQALMRLGAMVHSLDMGGSPVAEAAGFEAMLTGARERLPDDDALLAEIGGVLDSLYTHFARDSARTQA